MMKKYMSFITQRKINKFYSYIGMHKKQIYKIRDIVIKLAAILRKF